MRLVTQMILSGRLVLKFYDGIPSQFMEGTAQDVQPRHLLPSLLPILFSGPQEPDWSRRRMSDHRLLSVRRRRSWYPRRPEHRRVSS